VAGLKSMSRRRQTTDNDRRVYLLKRGWLEVAGDGRTTVWEHPELEHPWPLADAYDVQREAESCSGPGRCPFWLLHSALVGRAS